MSWRFLAYDLLSEAFLGELDVPDWSHTDEFNGAGSFSATVQMEDLDTSITLPSAAALLDDDGATLLDDNDHVLVDDPTEVTVTSTRNTAALDATVPAKVLIVAERDGVPDFAGIPWRRRYNPTSRTLEIAGAGLLSFFDHLKPAADYTPSGVDQLTIFATLAARGSEIGIVGHSETSGVNRTRTYLRLSNKKPGEYMRELAAVINGFDFDFRVEYVADAPVRTRRLFYPRRGRGVTTSNVRFRVPGNASIVSVDEDAVDISTEVIGFGAGEGIDLIESAASNTKLAEAGYPNYGSTVSFKDVSVQATLDEHTAAALRDRSVIDTEEFVLDIDPDDIGHPYGSWTIGDDAYVIIENDPRFPAQIDGTPGLVAARRIVSHTWTVNAGAEKLAVGLDLPTAVRATPTGGAGLDPDVDRRLRSLEGV